ncbi:hypothetical protein TREPR_2071 [Treponema primitia ZAS-2]|uniref:Uncharacterized protein n=1 Tax=Treponema primitia (strain ATCC BAA-887 / DSM 12427 / ZAS-2) TaxID=545694 RepID=F5YJR7_TREPZ|nr:hypothetical protein [Treponema primitia]AEF84209.1 hypothetical protein TREPR_2071 [Treponema primitia ZAS-2]
MAKTRKTKEKDLIDQMLDQVNLKGLSRDEVLGQDGLLKQLTGKLLSKIQEKFKQLGRRAINVGVDVQNYRPVSIEEVIKKADAAG